MTVIESRERLSADAEKLSHVEFLLELYPETTDEELKQIAHFLQTAPSLDLGLLSANSRAWRKAEEIRKSHPKLFRAKARTWIVLSIGVLTIALIVTWLWDSGLKH